MVRKYFDEIWDTISTLQGHEFRTKSGEKFKYHIEDNPLGISLEGKKVKKHIDESNFFKTYLYMNQYMVSTPDDIRSVAVHRGEDQVNGSPYIWAILNDERVLASSVA